MNKTDFEKCEAIVASLSPDEKTILRDCIREWAALEAPASVEASPDEVPAAPVVDASPKTTKPRVAEMMRFENFLWQHHNPAEVLEDWADKATEGIMRLAVSCMLDPSEVQLPLSPVVDGYVRYAHEFFRIPVEERGEDEIVRDFYPGAELTDDELRWVARHIQDGIIPAD